MRKKGSKARRGKKVKCPKCGYIWKTKQDKHHYICCSRCKRYFKVNRK